MTIEQFASVVGIISAICAGLYFLHKEFKRKQKFLREKLSGKWTNEGDVTGSHLETHYVDLSLTVDIIDGEITGIIQSRELKGDNEMKNVSVNGKLRFNKGKIDLHDVKRGRLVTYGKAKLKITSNGKSLIWNLNGKSIGHFPKVTRLWKSFNQTLPTSS